MDKDKAREILAADVTAAVDKHISAINAEMQALAYTLIEREDAQKELLDLCEKLFKENENMRAGFPPPAPALSAEQEREIKARLELAKLGARIKALREERGLSRKEFIGLIGFKSTSALGLIERGDRGTTTTSLNKIAAALGVETRDLYK